MSPDPLTTSRRGFLQLAGFSIAALAMPRLPGWLEAESAVDLPALGLSLRIPAPWHFVAGAELESIRADTVLPGGEAAKARVVAMAGDPPLLVAARERSPGPGPTFVLWRQTAGAGDHASSQHEAFASIHEHIYRRYARWLPEYTVVERGRAAWFAGAPASRVVVQYREQRVGQAPWMVRLESHLLRWEHSWLTFNCLGLADARDATAADDFRAVEQSVRLYTPLAP